MGKSRKRINSHVFTMVLQSGGRGAIFHPTDINPGPALFQSNGVHLSRLDSLVEAIVIFPFYHSKKEYGVGSWVTNNSALSVCLPSPTLAFPGPTF